MTWESVFSPCTDGDEDDDPKEGVPERDAVAEFEL